MGDRPRVLIIGEDSGTSESAKRLGFRPIFASQPQEALAKLRGTRPSLVLIDLPGAAVEDRWLHQLSKGCPILIVGDPGMSLGTPSPGNGKIQIINRPLREGDLDAALRSLLEGAVDHARRQRSERYLADYGSLFDHSPGMRVIRDVIEQVADTNTTVLIQGESGVGKELVAQAIHHASPRHDQPFVKVNCAALPGELLESELFGHEKGAFTGAYRRKLGKFEYANKGTLLLDEIGELPLSLQAKLLQVLQDQEFSRVGGRELIRVDARVIASTNRNLEAALAKGQFREDLYYRLNVVEIHVPPLRERTEEIPGLVTHFLDKFQRQYGREAKLAPDTIRLFGAYGWPGNVRELENTIRRLVVLGNVQQIQEQILTGLKTNRAQQSGRTPETETLPPSPSDGRVMGLREIASRAAREAERRAVLEILDRVHWNRTKAARLLRISYKTLLSKITECGLAPKQRRDAS